VKTDVSIVLCTYNRANMLGSALESLARQETDGKFTFDVVVVDDRSTDGTEITLQKIAKDSRMPIRCVRGEGRGIAAARNMSVRAASGEWLAFFDDDQVAETNWLKELLALALKTGSQCVGGARPLLLTTQELSKLSPICKQFLGEIAQGNEPKRCSRKLYPCTGNMLLRRSALERVGQFNESLTRGGEDIEFSARLHRAELEAWFTPKAIVRHQVPAYRLNESYLTWRALVDGGNMAYRDFREWGLAKTVTTCSARIAQASLINFPLMLLAYIAGNSAEVIGRKCLILRAWGYLRESLRLVSPRLFPQQTFFSRLSFRGERNAFAVESRGVAEDPS